MQSFTNTLFVPTYELYLAVLLVLVISVNKTFEKCFVWIPYKFW